MKNNKLKYVAIVFAFQTLFACTPDKYLYVDTNVAYKDSIATVELIANHKILVADGHAQIDFRPLLYTHRGYLIVDERVQPEWLDYKTSDGKTISRNFSADASMIGKTISVSFKVKDTDIVSNSVDVTIVAPTAEPTARRMPVVFHIVQTKDDIESYGGEFPAERINQIVTKINNVFGNLVTTYPTGINTHIKFELAKYDPFGRIMPEKGINRFTGKNIDATTLPGIIENNLLWSPENYLNIWLISDRLGKIDFFGETISNHYLPKYVKSGVDMATIPEGLKLTEVSTDLTYSALESGVPYRLQDLLNFSFSATVKDANNKTHEGNNELTHYIGCYLGLAKTFTIEQEIRSDYCDDTIDYFFDDKAPNANKQLYKKTGGCYFLSENIMDDASGSHRVVSQKQYERINWVLNNCPERSAWKSSFAFDGKKR